MSELRGEDLTGPSSLAAVDSVTPPAQSAVGRAKVGMAYSGHGYARRASSLASFSFAASAGTLLPGTGSGWRRKSHIGSVVRMPTGAMGLQTMLGGQREPLVQGKPYLVFSSRGHEGIQRHHETGGPMSMHSPRMEWLAPTAPLSTIDAPADHGDKSLKRFCLNLFSRECQGDLAVEAKGPFTLKKPGHPSNIALCEHGVIIPKGAPCR